MSLFITFEGGEGSGKSSALRLLDERLRAEGYQTVLTREPGGTWLSEQIRALIKDQSQDPPCDRAETLLFLAARAQLVERVIMPALERGEWVVSDRFSDSTLAYQGHGRGLPLDLLAEKTHIFPSKGEARKMIQANGFSLNKEKLTDPATPLTDANLLNGKYLLFQKGKKNYYLVIAK